jgi:hypothetical protein
MMRTTGGPGVSRDGDSTFASARKKVPRGFLSPISIGTGSSRDKGTGFMGFGRVRRVVFFPGWVLEVSWVVGEVESSAAQLRLN